MTGKTHLAGGLAAGLLLESFFNQVGRPIIFRSDQSWQMTCLLIGIAGFAALLPDMDEPNAILANLPKHVKELLRRSMGRTRKKNLGWLIWTIAALILSAANFLTRLFAEIIRILANGHRNATHWIATCCIVSFIIEAIGRTMNFADVGILFFVGYISHLILDLMTPLGLEALQPITEYRFHLLPKSLRITTSSSGDQKMCFIFSLVFTLLLLRFLVII